MASSSLASGLSGAAKVLAGHHTEPRVTMCDVATIGASTHWMCPKCDRFVRYDHQPFLSACDGAHGGSSKKDDRNAPSMSGAELEGLVVFPDFVTADEEASYIEFFDTTAPETGRSEAWKATSQSKRRQDYGPQANFKKKRIMVRDGLKAMPLALKKFIRRVEKSLSQEEGVGTVHFKPVTIPPRRVLPTKQLAKWSQAPAAAAVGWDAEHGGDSAAFTPLVPWGKRAREEKAARDARKAAEAEENGGHYEEKNHAPQKPAAPSGPAFVRGAPIGAEDSKAPPAFTCAHVAAVEYAPGTSFLHPQLDDTWLWGNRIACVSLGSATTMTFVTSSMLIVDVQLPERALYVLSGPSRYNALHGIRPENVTEKRVSITVRELAEGFVHSTDAENLETIRTFCKTFA